MAKLIALYSTVPQSGKTTTANWLVQKHGFTAVKFAGPLKSMLYTLLRQFKDDPDWVYRCIEGDLKEAPLKFLGGQTPRQLMISLGTNWGREMVDPSIWVVATYARASRLLEAGKDVVVDDMRFPNEYAALGQLGAAHTQVTRLGRAGTGDATTEGLLAKHPWPYTLWADDGDIQGLCDATDRLVESL